jgi:hypothetical protein
MFDDLLKNIIDLFRSHNPFKYWYLPLSMQKDRGGHLYIQYAKAGLRVRTDVVST